MERQYKFLVILVVTGMAILSCSILGSDSSSTSNAELPANILFQDDFSDISSGWDQYNDVDAVTDYADGVYRIFVNTDNTDVWANPGLTFTDVTIDVDATKVAGPDDNDFGVICRYQDVENFYFFVISSDGFYGIVKVVEGEQAIIGQENMEFSDVINLGNTSNRIHAECIGENLALHVNDQMLLEVSDTQFTSGDVGLIAGTFDNTGTDIHFDNFVVKQP